MVINELYYGSSCQCHPKNTVTEGIRIDQKVLHSALRKIYKGFDTDTSILPTLFRAVLQQMNTATVEGLSQGNLPDYDTRLLEAIRHSNEVFSVFKVHGFSKVVASRLLDSQGKLKPFKEWYRDVSPIVQHHMGGWLQTEYNTAVLRAHAIAQWQEFELNKDVLPNLRWMPTTSPHPEASHRIFWEKKLTLPIGHPFWDAHHPADRWNCKCGLEATDDPIQGTELLNDEELPQPQRGLENNPAKDGAIFSDKHPYFPASCNTCPFFKPKGFKDFVKKVFNNRDKDCHNCPYADKAINDANEKGKKMTKEELSKKYDSQKWEHTYLDEETGGYVVTEKERIEKGKINGQEKAVFDKEISMCKTLAQNGYQVEYLSDIGRAKDETYDIKMDGIRTDLKSLSSAGNLVKQVKHALRDQGADIVVVRLENREEKLSNALLEARRKVKGRILYYYADEATIKELQ